MIDRKFTGRKRYRTARVRTGLFSSKEVLVLQYEVKGFVPEFTGGAVDGAIRCRWVDAKPEWEMTALPS